ncbi:MAG: DUF924 family protein [Hyphomicrobiaceae bacterium]
MASPDAGDARWTAEVLQFWFAELQPADWFKRSDAVDESIRQRFMGVHRQVALNFPAATQLTPHGTLAAVIVLDQFPRNVFRGSANAFATDAQALALARDAVDLGYDQAFHGAQAKHERLFLYLPFEHSERLEDQRRSVALISALGDDDLTRFALAHQVIIERFGRFPHRNAALGRVSTPEELEFLTQPGSGF